jgi:hypothetical protein
MGLNHRRGHTKAHGTINSPKFTELIEIPPMKKRSTKMRPIQTMNNITKKDKTKGGEGGSGSGMVQGKQGFE